MSYQERFVDIVDNLGSVLGNAICRKSVEIREHLKYNE
jgi:hypothetical protein